jgi:hypothetical protein
MGAIAAVRGPGAGRRKWRSRVRPGSEILPQGGATDRSNLAAASTRLATNKLAVNVNSCRF